MNKIEKVKCLHAPYSAVRHEFKTGDQLLCSGKSFVSYLIKLVTLSDISHTAKVVVNVDGVWVWESTSLGKGVDGVRMTLMSEWLQEYNGKVYYRPLRFERDGKFHWAYRDLRAEYKGKKYEQNWWELAGAAMPWKNKDTAKSKITLFCSEMTALADFFSGVISLGGEFIANETTPADYLPGRKIDKIIALNSNKPAAFGRMVRLK